MRRMAGLLALALVLLALPVAMAGAESELRRTDVTAGAKARTLTVDLRGEIGLQDDRMRRAIGKLQAENPDAQVEFVSLSDEQLNRELALKFLLNYIDPEVVFAEGGYDHMRLDEAQYVDMEQFPKRERALIPENQAACAQAMPGRETYGFLIACEGWMPQYYDGRITLDELVAALQREWDMRRLG